MKELSIEEKAKRYDEALKKAKSKIKDDKDHVLYEDDVIEIFPELKQSEGESTRKRIIALVNAHGQGMFKESMLAWLEKQGEHKPAMIQWKGDNLKEVVDFTGVYKEGFEKWFHNSWEEYEKYVREHNNIFKIFNEDGSHMEVPVGAWVIKAPDGYNTASRFTISPILTEISIESNFKFKKAVECIENYVNSFPHSQRPEIWQHINFLKSFKGRVQPQTQCEWSEEDKKRIDQICEDLRCGMINFNANKNVKGLHFEEIIESNIAWLKELAERIALQPKQEWSEEDEKMIENIIDTINMSIEDCDVDDIGTKARFSLEKERDWLKNKLKFLRPQSQWKPSDEQMENLSRAFNGGTYRASLLMELYQDLKKLKD